MRFERGLPSVVTGQQAGLLGGPLFTLVKLLAAVKLARHRRERAIFWIECDDADILEVDQAHVVSAAGELRRFSLGAPDDGRPVAARTLDMGIDALLADLEASLAAGEVMAAAMTDLRDCWRPGVLWHVAFSRYLARLTSGMDITFVDPTSAYMKEAAAPLLARVLASPDAVEAAIAAGTTQVSHPQVAYIEGELPLFFLDDKGARRKLERRASGIGLKGTTTELSHAEARQLLERDPTRFSPGVLLRPIVQDFVLPTTLYVAGPSEAQYHKQLGPLYELLEVTRPKIVPRPRLTLVEARTRRLLEKLNLPLATAVKGEAAVVERLAVAESGLDPVAAATATAGALKLEIERLRSRLVEIDPGALNPAFEEAQTKIAHQVGRLGTRALESMRRKDGEAVRQARKLAALLTPNNQPQERVLNPIHFLSRIRREELIPLILDAIDPNDPGGQLQLDLGGAGPTGGSGS